MNAFWFSSVLIPTFSRPLIRNWCFDSNGSSIYKYILSISGCWFFINFHNTLFLPDPELPIVKIDMGGQE